MCLYRMIDHGEPVSLWPYLYKVQFGALLVDEKTSPDSIAVLRGGGNAAAPMLYY